MNPKTKKALIFTGLGIDVIVTIFLFVVAIIMLATMPKDSAAMENAQKTNGVFIGYLQQHSTLYLWTCVIPLFVLLAGNIVILILYIRKVGKKPEVAVDDLNEEQKAALRAELLKELQGESEEPKKEEKSE
jgi:ABC-type Na+ efflux pump permease subunit